MDPLQLYNERYMHLVQEVTSFDPETKEAKDAVIVLKTYSESRPPTPEPAPILEVVPTTILGKVQCGVARFWNNETTRVVIKTVGTFAGVALVVRTTVKQDHILERQALDQARQPPPMN